MRKTALLLTVVFCLPTLLGCQGGKGGFGGKTAAVSTEPVQDPDYYTDASNTYGESMYLASDPYADVATTDSTPMLSAPVAVETTPVGARYHTVAKGDTLYGLARRYYSDQRQWKAIFAANRDSIGDANKIRVGQRLLIP